MIDGIRTEMDINDRLTLAANYVKADTQAREELRSGFGADVITDALLRTIMGHRSNIVYHQTGVDGALEALSDLHVARHF